MIIILMMSLFMKTIHIKLYIIICTCLTKDVYFLCLKYCGNISNENFYRSFIKKPLPCYAHETMCYKSYLFMFGMVYLEHLIGVAEEGWYVFTFLVHLYSKIL